jgi:hypothetical protein
LSHSLRIASRWGASYRRSSSGVVGAAVALDPQAMAALGGATPTRRVGEPLGQQHQMLAEREADRVALVERRPDVAWRAGVVDVHLSVAVAQGGHQRLERQAGIDRVRGRLDRRVHDALRRRRP